MRITGLGLQVPMVSFQETASRPHCSISSYCNYPNIKSVIPDLKSETLYLLLEGMF